MARMTIAIDDHLMREVQLEAIRVASADLLRRRRRSDALQHQGRVTIVVDGHYEQIARHTPRKQRYLAETTGGGPLSRSPDHLPDGPP